MADTAMESKDTPLQVRDVCVRQCMYVCVFALASLLVIMLHVSLLLSCLCFQEKLTALAEKIGYFGFGSAIATFIAMIISWFADNDALVSEYPLFKVRYLSCLYFVP